jgi:ComF family protein
VCRDLKLPFDGVVCLGNYDGPLRSLVLRMKNRGQETLAIQFGRWLGELVAAAATGEHAADAEKTCELVTGVPVYWLKHLRRGYHVPDLLVEGLLATRRPRSRWRTLLRSVRPTRKQGTLTTDQRFGNVRGCFAVTKPAAVAGQRILLVDDVMTSGATAIEAARTLLGSGAASVRLAIVARGVRHGQ